MQPERWKVTNGHKIEQFYWAGRTVVYVDNKKFDGTFKDAVRAYS